MSKKHATTSMEIGGDGEIDQGILELIEVMNTAPWIKTLACQESPPHKSD
jgi:hypothetical protein